ncbi:MAG: amidase [Pseudomonadota bacterium]
MAEIWELGAAEAAQRIADGSLSAEDLMRALLARIDERDAAVGAWIHLDPDAALASARAADDVQARGYGIGPLHGVPVAIKDIIETADMPTQNGYAPHENRHTHRDAFCVSQLRDAGAIVMGKTVTTELATRHPGKTRNPVNPAHTPGGSSSGSAAAVRDGQVPIALGTQTGGSVIRPASFCGIHALKPTFGLIARAGVTMQADWLDTVGTYGRSIEDIALAAEVMLARDLADPQAIARSRSKLTVMANAEPPHRPRIAFMRGAMWDKADWAARTALEDFAASLGDDCVEVDMPGWMAEAWQWQRVLQLYGNAIHYGPLWDADGDAMSESLRKNIAEGREMTEAMYRTAIAQRDAVHEGLIRIYDDYDAILCLASAGAAPEGLGWTGDPVFNAFWTYAGTPCVTLPLLTVDGLPMGVQLTGPRGSDGALLRTARWVENTGRSG